MIVIQVDEYFALGLLLGSIIAIPLIAWVALWLTYWPGRFVQVGDEEYTPKGRFRFFRRFWNAHVFWIKYDVIWWD